MVGIVKKECNQTIITELMKILDKNSLVIQYVLIISKRSSQTGRGAEKGYQNSQKAGISFV